jgi:hypothetical protein
MKNKLPLPRVRRGSSSAAMDISAMELHFLLIQSHGNLV